MAKVKLHDTQAGRFWFRCPGCGDTHFIPTHPSDPLFAPHRWTFNGNLDKPTFHPSINTQSGHYVAGQRGKSCWCRYNAKQKAEGKQPSTENCYICHFWLKNGKIEFLRDCTHHLAGHSMDLPEIV